VEQAETQVSGAKAAFLPDLTAGLSGSQNYGRTFDQTEGQVLTEANQAFSGRLSAGVTLFNGMANIAAVRQAEEQREATLLSEYQMEQDVILAVISGFLDITAARQQMVMWEETLAAQEAMEANVEVLVEAGSRPISELYQQRASVASTRSSLVDARRAEQLADVAMVQILRLDPTREYLFEPPDTPLAAGWELQPDRLTLMEEAFSVRADIQALESRLAAAEQSIRIASANQWPDVSLSASYGSNYNSLSTLSFNDQLDRQMSGSLGLSISIPIYDRGNTSRAKQLAAIEVEESELDLEDLKQQVAVEVTRAILDRDAAYESLGAGEAEVEASTLALEYTTDRYDAGMATLLEVTQAQASLVAANTNLINARYNLAFQDQLLDYYLGQLTEGLTSES
jgi:outer membrane protein